MFSQIFKTQENSPKNSKSSDPLSLRIHKSKKCAIINYRGLITPKYKDDFDTFLFTENTEQSEKENSQNNCSKNIIKIKIIDNSKRIFWSNNPFSFTLNESKENKKPNTLQFKAKEEFIPSQIKIQLNQ